MWISLPLLVLLSICLPLLGWTFTVIEKYDFDKINLVLSMINIITTLVKLWFATNFSRVSRPYPFKFFKGCLPQNLLSPLLHTLSHLCQCVCVSHLSISLEFHSLEGASKREEGDWGLEKIKIPGVV